MTPAHARQDQTSLDERRGRVDAANRSIQGMTDGVAEARGVFGASISRVFSLDFFENSAMMTRVDAR
jgi:hypothetical protein